jgi:hypothetical protein
MAVAYRSGSHITPAAATSPATGTEPTGTVQDDYMLALFITESGVGGADLSRPTGWSNPDSEPALGYAATGNVFMELAGIVRGVSAPSFAFTWAANAPLSRQRELYIGTFSGVNTSGYTVDTASSRISSRRCRFGLSIAQQFSRPRLVVALPCSRRCIRMGP